MANGGREDYRSALLGGSHCSRDEVCGLHQSNGDRKGKLRFKLYRDDGDPKGKAEAGIRWVRAPLLVLEASIVTLDNLRLFFLSRCNCGVNLRSDKRLTLLEVSSCERCKEAEL